jgi:hypothetical protein
LTAELDELYAKSVITSTSDVDEVAVCTVVPELAVAAILIPRPSVEADSGILETVVDIYILLVYEKTWTAKANAWSFAATPAEAAAHSGRFVVPTTSVCPAVPISNLAGVFGADAYSRSPVAVRVETPPSGPVEPVGPSGPDGPVGPISP